MFSLSVIVTTYNHSEFVVSALRSLFVQDYPGPFEIVVCDDASSDDTLEKLKALAAEKPSHIRLFFPPPSPNVGLIRNLERGVFLASGELLVLQSGDDMSAPNRLSAMVKLFAENPQLLGAYSNAILVDAKYRVIRPLYHPQGFVWRGDVLTLAVCSSAFLGASSCYRREVWEKFTKLDARIVQEDLVLPFRASLLGATAYLSEPLVCYRLHGSNVFFSDSSTLTPETFRANRFRQVRSQILAHRQRLSDLIELKPAHPESRKIEVAIRRQITEAEFEVSLEDKSKSAIIAKLLCQVVSRSLRHTARLLAHHVVPSLYCAYHHWKGRFFTTI